MKICFVTYGLDQFNGYGRYSLNLIRGLKERDITGPILIFKNRNIPKDLKSITHPILKHNPTSPLINPLKLFQDYLNIKRYSKDCDAIHFLTESFLATTIFRYSKPYFSTVYGTWAIKPLTSNIISRHIFTNGYKKSKQIISISKYTKKKLFQLIKLNNINVIYPGININLQKPKITYSNKLKILSVAALNPSKGLHISLETIARLSQENKNIFYTIISGRKNPSYEVQLKNIAKKYNFENLKIKYQISDKELVKIYKNSNIFILTPIEKNNDIEGFGLIFIEAFASGIPVIASNSGAISEVVQDKKTGLLTRENNIEDTQKKLEYLIDNPNYAKKLAIQAQKNIYTFSTQRMIQDYIKIYYKK